MNDPELNLLLTSLVLSIALNIVVNFFSALRVPGVEDVVLCLNFANLMFMYDKVIGASCVFLAILLDNNGNCFHLSWFAQQGSGTFYLAILIIVASLYSFLTQLQSFGRNISKRNKYGIITICVSLFLWYSFIFGFPFTVTTDGSIHYNNDWLNHYKNLHTRFVSTNYLEPLDRYRVLTNSDWFLQSAFKLERIVRSNEVLKLITYLMFAPIAAPDMTTSFFINANSACVYTFTFFTLILRLFSTLVFLSGFASVSKLKKSFKTVTSNGNTASQTSSAKKSRARRQT